jgi:type I restriction enzyme S subunit
MDKKKNIPQLRFPEYKGVWEKKTVGDLGVFTGGGTPDTTIAKYWNGDVPWISSSDIQDDTVQEYLISRFITDEAIKKSATKIVPQNSILIVSRVGIGKFAVSKSPVCTSQDFTSLTPLVDNPYFLAYYFKEKTNLFLRFSQGTSIKGFTGTDIRNMVFQVPSLPEQQKIASFFTAIDQKISQLKRKKILLEQYKKGVIQKIFSQEIRFRDDNGQEFPKWEKMTGDALFETVSNKNHNSDLPILAITQEHGAIPRDMIDYYITVSEQSVESYKVVEKGDFIISLRSFQGGIEYSEYTGICSPAYIILRATQRIDHRYFKYYFKTDKYITDLNRKLEGIRDGKMISYKYFSEIEINVPSLPEQTKISNFLSAIDDKFTHTQNQIEKAEVWKKGLMQQMFV